MQGYLWRSWKYPYYSESSHYGWLLWWRQHLNHGHISIDALKTRREIGSIQRDSQVNTFKRSYGTKNKTSVVTSRMGTTCLCVLAADRGSREWWWRRAPGGPSIRGPSAGSCQWVSVAQWAVFLHTSVHCYTLLIRAALHLGADSDIRGEKTTHFHLF